MALGSLEDAKQDFEIALDLYREYGEAAENLEQVNEQMGSTT